MRTGREKAGEIDKEMRKHVAKKVALPEIEQHEEHRVHTYDEQLRGSPSREMSQGKNNDRDQTREPFASAQLLHPLNRIPAVNDFLHHPGAQEDKNLKPEREPGD